jgi:hypothetical protein
VALPPQVQTGCFQARSQHRNLSQCSLPFSGSSTEVPSAGAASMNHRNLHLVVLLSLAHRKKVFQLAFLLQAHRKKVFQLAFLLRAHRKNIVEQALLDRIELY